MNRSEIKDATLTELVMALRTATIARDYGRIEDEILGRIEALRQDMEKLRAFAEHFADATEDL